MPASRAQNRPGWSGWLWARTRKEAAPTAQPVAAAHSETEGRLFRVPDGVHGKDPTGRAGLPRNVCTWDTAWEPRAGRDVLGHPAPTESARRALPPGLTGSDGGCHVSWTDHGAPSPLAERGSGCVWRVSTGDQESHPEDSSEPALAATSRRWRGRVPLCRPPSGDKALLGPLSWALVGCGSPCRKSTSLARVLMRFLTRGPLPLAMTGQAIQEQGC